MKKNQLTRILACSMLALCFFSACKKVEDKKEEESTTQSARKVSTATTSALTTFTFKRGINLSTWLSHMSSIHGKTNGTDLTNLQYVTEAHIQQLKDDGYDHIRLPVDESLFYTNSEARTQDAATVQLVKNCIAWCETRGMKVILNLHIPGNRAAGGFKKEDYWVPKPNAASRKNHAVLLWKDWSNTFKNYSVNVLAYELFNEPNCPSDAEWNTFQNQMIAAVRLTEPNRVLFVGPNQDNSVSKLQYLQLPTNDPNLIVSFHFYQPVALTHYPLSYTDANGNKVTPRIKLKYPGQIFGDTQWESIADKNGLNIYSGNFNDSTQIVRLKPVVTYVNSTKNSVNPNGLRVHCGEFGCNDDYEKQTSPFPQGTEELKYKVFKDYATVFYNMKNHADPTKKAFIPYTVWGYKGSFGLYHVVNGATVQKYPAKTINGTYYNSIKWMLTGMYPNF